MRHTKQYPTTGSLEEMEKKKVYPKYESSISQSYNCGGAHTPQTTTVTSIFKWLKKTVTDNKNT